VPNDPAQPKRELTPDQWRQIRELLATAINLPVEKRAAYVAAVSQNSAALRAELESLIAAHEDAAKLDGFASPIALFDSRLQPQTDRAPNTDDWQTNSDDLGISGKSISHYRVLEKLGGGGMGLVYRAEDIKLGRFVALKFLPKALADDHEAVKQLQSEARAASALNHPHICIVHDIDEWDRQPFIVMELLEGKTLTHYLASTRLDTRQIAALGMQIADAL